MHISWAQDTLAQKISQNNVEEKMLIALQQRKSNIIGTRKRISRGDLASHLKPV